MSLAVPGSMVKSSSTARRAPRRGRRGSARKASSATTLTRRRRRAARPPGGAIMNALAGAPSLPRQREVVTAEGVRQRRTKLERIAGEGHVDVVAIAAQQSVPDEATGDIR